MMKKLLVPMFVFGLAGCAKAPTDKITAAERALGDARAAEAAPYNAAEFTALETQFADAQKEVQAQEGKFALSRDFKKAEELLAAVSTGAEKLKADAATAKAEATTRATEAHKLAVEEIGKALAAFSATTPEEQTALAEIKTKIDELNAEAEKVNGAITGGNALEAETQAKALQEKAVALNADLNARLEAMKAEGAKKPS
jgi:hypothetical protein